MYLEIYFDDPDIVKLDPSSHVGSKLSEMSRPGRLPGARAAFASFKEAWRTGAEVESSVPFAAPDGNDVWVTVVARRVGDLFLAETFAAASTIMAAVRAHLGLVKV